MQESTWIKDRKSQLKYASSPQYVQETAVVEDLIQNPENYSLSDLYENTDPRTFVTMLRKPAAKEFDFDTEEVTLRENNLRRMRNVIKDNGRTDETHGLIYRSGYRLAKTIDRELESLETDSSEDWEHDRTEHIDGMKETGAFLFGAGILLYSGDMIAQTPPEWTASTLGTAAIGATVYTAGEALQEGSQQYSQDKEFEEEAERHFKVFEDWDVKLE